MSTFETSATVQEQGQILVAGVPFAPGTEVEVVISPKAQSTQKLTHALDEAARPDPGLQWSGNVLVHQGVGAAPSVGELRDERLHRLGESRSG